MRPKLTALLASLTVLAGLSTATIAAAQPAMPPPPPEFGPPPPPPGPAERWVLEPSHWHWDGYRYVWVHCLWVPIQIGYHFIPGHWAFGPYGQRWVPAHWGR